MARPWISEYWIGTYQLIAYFMRFGLR